MRKFFKIFISVFLLIGEAYGGCRYCDFWGSNHQPFYVEFNSCILALPEPIEFLGPCNRIDQNYCYSREGLARQAKDYYLIDHFPSYSVVGIAHLFNQLRKDVNKEYNSIINYENNFISDVLSGEIKRYPEEQYISISYAYKKISTVQQAKTDVIPIIMDYLHSS
jgi:hypothetical protein